MTFCSFLSESPHKVFERLDDDEKDVSQIDPPRGKQNMTIISEVGLYSALFSMQPEKGRNLIPTLRGKFGR